MIDIRTLKAEVEFNLQMNHGTTLLTAFTDKQRHAMDTLVNAVVEAANHELEVLQSQSLSLLQSLMEVSAAVQKIAAHVDVIDTELAALMGRVAELETGMRDAQGFQKGVEARFANENWKLDS